MREREREIRYEHKSSDWQMPWAKSKDLTHVGVQIMATANVADMSCMARVSTRPLWCHTLKRQSAGNPEYSESGVSRVEAKTNRMATRLQNQHDFMFENRH